MNNFFGKFSEILKQLLLLAERIANDLGDQLDTQHLIYAMVSSKDNLAFDILHTFDITAPKIDVLSRLISRQTNSSRMGVSVNLKSALLSAIKIAANFGQNQVEVEHLLLALVSDKTFKSYQIIERAGVKPDKIRQQLEQMFHELRQAIDRDQDFAGPPFMGLNPMEDNGLDFPSDDGAPFPVSSPTPQGQKEKSLLETFGIDLNKEAAKGKLDPVVGREQEINRVIQILSRRTKNNPVLLGEPGVGKTAIVEGLADRIVKGKTPGNLINKIIIALDLGAIVAGTMFRGQFEARLKKIIDEISQRGNIIIFLDELHTVIGTGSAEGSLDAANLLKPMLSKGQLRLIGATTFDEYKKNIEKDKAFERRFQVVKVNEPSAEETLKILQGLRHKYESYHGIKYDNEALVAAVKLSDRYISDRFLPDKAIDLMDEAAAATNVTLKNTTSKVALQRKFEEIAKQKEKAVSGEDYQKATSLREEEIKVERGLKKLSASENKTQKKIVVVEDIAKIVAFTTGIPITDLKTSESLHLVNLEARLKKEIVGQDQAVKNIAEAIKRSRVGIGDPNRPIGSFIFLGPTGVGKTELARVLSRLVFGSSKALVKIDMSEFMEKHNVSRLVGAPAGYVGYDEGGKLTETIRHQPYSLILFDEIEKAHPDVFNILLQILEDGYLTDAKGRRVNFKNTLIIMTSNMGSNIFQNKAMGFRTENIFDEAVTAEQVLENSKKILPPEFINRLDKIIVFNPLKKADLQKIVSLRLRDLEKRLNNLDIDLEYTDEAKDLLVEKGFNPNSGARPLKRVIADQIETKISDLVLKYKSLGKRTIKVDRQNKALIVSVV